MEKFNYLRAELEGDASAVISGLELTNSSYEVAVNLLQERFGRDELMMDAHYSALMDLPVSLNVTAKLAKHCEIVTASSATLPENWRGVGKIKSLYWVVSCHLDG